MELLTPKEALSKGYLSIAEVIKQGLSDKHRTSLFRDAVAGTLPACKVKRGSVVAYWLLVQGLGKPIIRQDESSYSRLRDLWFSEMRNGTFGGKPYSEQTITNYSFALDKFWSLLGKAKCINDITPDNFSLVMGAFPHDPVARKDYFASKLKCYEAITGFVNFLIRKDIKTKDCLIGLRLHRPKPRYERNKKLIEDYEIEEAIRTNINWRIGRSTHDVMSMDLLLHLFGYAGVRREEAVILKREDIFFKEKLIKVFGKNSLVSQEN